jgi:hypothetical protein
MIKETRQLFCDICGKEIACGDYSCRREVIEIDEDGYAHSVGYDMCKDCTESFNDWKEERRAKRRADEKSDQLFCWGPLLTI